MRTRLLHTYSRGHLQSVLIISLESRLLLFSYSANCSPHFAMQVPGVVVQSSFIWCSIPVESPG